MVKVLRVVKNITIWKYDPEDYNWLGENDIPSDPLQDLNTSENKLSVWEVENDQEKINRFIAAYASNRNNLKRLEYILIEPELLRGLNLKCDYASGDLVDSGINRWHFDLIELTIDKIIELTKAIIHSDFYAERKNLEEVAFLINESIKKGWIERKKVNPQCLIEMGKYIKE